MHDERRSFIWLGTMTYLTDKVACCKDLLPFDRCKLAILYMRHATVAVARDEISRGGAESEVIPN